jgi:hypothetical protein
MQVSHYVVSIRNWMIRSLIERYLRARDTFLSYLADFRNGQLIPFENIMALSDQLFSIKEDNYLIFRRVLDPRRMVFEEAPKFTPSEAEVRFMNNVGLIFHKVMVARELKYVMEHYQADSQDYEETYGSLNYYLERIEKLFNEGLEIIRLMLPENGDNTVLLVYLLENREYMERTFGVPLWELLAPMIPGDVRREAYARAVEYYVNSGWAAEARRMLARAREDGVDPDAWPRRIQDRLLELESRLAGP